VEDEAALPSRALAFRRIRALLLPLALAAAVFAVSRPASATVEQATFMVNRGAAGIKLGMTRGQVVAHLGQPLFENANGFMEYSADNLFDVYLDATRTPKRVRMISFSGRDYCTASGICSLRRGGVGKLRTQFGSRLIKKDTPTGRCYQILGHYQGEPVFTSFTVGNFIPSGRIFQVFILYGAGDVC
jgi:hypothetical protein